MAITHEASPKNTTFKLRTHKTKTILLNQLSVFINQVFFTLCNILILKSRTQAL
jgi:hypothetical protein